MPKSGEQEDQIGAEAGGGQHGDDRLGHVRHEADHPVAGLDPLARREAAIRATSSYSWA